MDVKCERCNTEYEFDDALVSGRGTTVKCTNCGHKFKIRRGDGDFSEDFWNVTTSDGRTLVFTSLRELQRAIQTYLVERNDRLSRGGLAQKPIGQIPELLPFFEQRETAKRREQAQPNKSVKTQDGIGPSTSIPPPLPGSSEKPRQPTKPEFLQPPLDVTPTPSAGPAGAATLVGTGPVSDEPAFRPGARVGSVPPPPTIRDSDLKLDPDDSTEIALAALEPLPSPKATPPMLAPPPRAKTDPPPATERLSTPTVAHSRSIPPPLPPPRHSSASMPVASRPPPMPPVPSSPPRISAPPAPPRPITSSIPARSLRQDVIDDDRPSLLSVAPQSRRKRSVGGFVVAAVVLGGLVAVGAVWAQKNLGGLTGKPVGPTAPSADPRAAAFLLTGERALADGNLELAKESFDKAIALNEKDAHTLLDIARLAAIRADVPWLRTRLLPPDATDENRIARDDLAGLAATAKKTAEEALAAAPDDPAALRAKVDALRIAGDRDARALAAKIPSVSAQPETAYVRAALDLADAEPGWPSVIERLKTASSAETGPGRARAALVYALARSGDRGAAKAEVDRLTAMTKAHPLLPLLRSFADKAQAVAIADGGADAASTAATAVVVAVGDAGKGHVGAGGVIPTDSRELVTQGERARAKGDYARATTLFNAAVDKNPNDSEALAGLASVAYAEHDLVTARGSYKRVLASNPNYMPALIGIADVEWDSGDKVTAQKMYKDIVDRYPDGSYPARVKQRSEGT